MRPAGGRTVGLCLDLQHSHRAILPTPGRGKGVVDEVLGESPGQGDGMLFSGVLVSDFYAAYSHYPGLKQRCWVHRIDELKAYPKDTGRPMGHSGAPTL